MLCFADNSQQAESMTGDSTAADQLAQLVQSAPHQAMAGGNNAVPGKQSPGMQTHSSQHQQQGLTSNAVTNVAESDHAAHDTQNLRVVWCSCLVQVADGLRHVGCGVGASKLEAPWVLKGENGLNVADGEDVVGFAEHAHAWDRPATKPPLHTKVSSAKFQLHIRYVLKTR